MEPEPEPIRVPITDVFDLHTVPPRDVKGVVEEYLIEARRMGFKALRIIHGRGIGAQREMVRAILSRTGLWPISRTPRPKPEAGEPPSSRCGRGGAATSANVRWTRCEPVRSTAHHGSRCSPLLDGGVLERSFGIHEP